MSDQLSAQVEQLARARGLDISPEVVAQAVSRVLAALGESPAVSGNGRRYSTPSTTIRCPASGPTWCSRQPVVTSMRSPLTGSSPARSRSRTSRPARRRSSTRPRSLSAGRPPLAGNLRRAAEMTRIPDARVLEIYNALRPYRSSKQQLLDIAEELDSQYQATICAAHVREAAEVYERHGRLAR